MEPLGVAALARDLKACTIMLLDVRPKGEFALGHLQGATNTPLRDLARRLKSLTRGKQIVAYCRGPYCVLDLEAFAMLREKGFSARRLDGGIRSSRRPACRQVCTEVAAASPRVQPHLLETGNRSARFTLLHPIRAPGLAALGRDPGWRP